MTQRNLIVRPTECVEDAPDSGALLDMAPAGPRSRLEQLLSETPAEASAIDQAWERMEPVRKEWGAEK